MRRHGAFSLLEVLVSVTILLILVLLASGILNHLARMTQGSTGHLRSQGDARESLDFITSELATATPPLPWQGGPRPRMRLSPPEAGFPHAHLLCWQTPADPSRSTTGLETIVYFVRWGDATAHGEPFQPVLCRAAIPVVGGSGGTPPVVYTDQDWLKPDFLDQHAPANELNDYKGLFAERVLALWVRALDHHGNAITQDAAGVPTRYRFDSEAGYTDSAGKVYRAPAFPASLELALIVIEDTATNRLTRPAEAPSATNPEHFHTEIASFIAMQPPSVRSGIRVYLRRVPLYCRP